MASRVIPRAWVGGARGPGPRGGKLTHNWKYRENHYQVLKNPQGVGGGGPGARGPGGPGPGGPSLLITGNIEKNMF